MRTQFHYKNHRGDVELRDVDVLALVYVATPHLEYGYAPGLAFQCRDYSRGRDGSEQRTFFLSNIQMEGFKYNTKGGAIAWALDLGGVGESPVAHKSAGVKDANGVELFEGDRVLYENQGPDTKPEYWNPEYQIVWEAPKFTLKHVGGGKDGGSHDFMLKHGGGNGCLFKLDPRTAKPFADEPRVFYLWQGKEYNLTGWMTDVIKHPYTSQDERLHGKMYGHAGFEEGELVTTSRIVAEIAPNVFLTKSGSVYRVDSWRPNVDR